jgi:hypothetical protein
LSTTRTSYLGGAGPLTAKAGRNCGEAHGFHGPPLSLFPRL